MNWLLIALISPFLWAITNHIDKHLVAEYSKRIKFTSFIIFAAMFFCVSALTIFVFKPDVIQLELKYILLVMLTGACYIFYLFPYYFALREDEASIVAPMFQMVPVIGFVLAFLFLGERLSLVQTIAGLIIISGSIGLSLDFSEKIRIKGKIFFLMFLSSLTISVGTLLYKFVVVRNDFWTAIFWEEVGIIISCLGLLLVKSYRDNFLQTIGGGNKKFIAIMGVNELLTWGAGLIFSYAYILSPIALVQLVGSIQPLFVLVLGILGAVFIPKFTYEGVDRKSLIQKSIFIAIILSGSYLLFTNL